MGWILLPCLSDFDDSLLVKVCGKINTLDEGWMDAVFFM